MTRYLISFEAHAMITSPREMPDVGIVAHKVAEGGLRTPAVGFGGGLESKKATSWPPTGRYRWPLTRKPSADS
jgi:hypothetical protein